VTGPCSNPDGGKEEPTHLDWKDRYSIYVLFDITLLLIYTLLVALF
jgi:hypothetical protein